jgi:hypothetical protein
MTAHARLEKQWKDPRKKYQSGEHLVRCPSYGLTDIRGKNELEKMYEDDDKFTG